MQTDKNNGIYQDLGAVVPLTAVSDGTYAESEWFDNYAWVRRFLFKIRSNKAWSLHIWRRNSDGSITDWGTTTYISVSAGGTGTSYHTLEVDNLSGYSFKVGLRNDNGVGESANMALALEVFR